MSYAHPGSIQVQVGRCWQLFLANVEQEDVFGTANAVRAMKTCVWPYLALDKDRRARYEQVPTIAAAKDATEAFELENQRMEILMEVLHKHNIFGYNQPQAASAESIAMGWED